MLMDQYFSLLNALHLVLHVKYYNSRAHDNYIVLDTSWAISPLMKYEHKSGMGPVSVENWFGTGLIDEDIGYMSLKVYVSN